MQPRVVVALVAALLLLGLNGEQLLGYAYARIAEQRLDTADAGTAADVARMARDLQPWSSRDAALEGWARAGDRDSEGALAAYADALRAAPADPMLWAEYALVLARLGHFDPTLTTAVEQADALAPQSPAVQGALADLGIGYWDRGTAEQRAHWLSGMRYEQRHERPSLLTRVVSRGRIREFCEHAAKSLGEENWCDGIAPIVLGNGCYTISAQGPVPCPPP